MKIKGVQHPLSKHPQGFFHNASSDMNQVKSDMAAIILTEPGERLFVPYFGTRLKSINLNAPVEMVKSNMRVEIASALKKWEKRVQVHDIIVDFAKDSEDRLIAKISILFINPVNINNIETLTVYKSLGDASRAMPF